MNEFWDSVDIAAGDCLLWSAGPLRIWLRRMEDEWQVAAQQGDHAAAADLVAARPVEPPEGIEWSRWRGGRIENSVQIQPVMPDRPLVARPLSPLHILPAHKEEFFIGIPLFLRVVIGKDRTADILETPSQTLSNTWFGDPMAGELCYSLATRARTDAAAVEAGPLEVISRVVIDNQHSEALHFERICLQSEYMSVYSTDAGLLSNDVAIVYQGEDKMSRIRYSKRAPQIEGKIARIGAARRPIEENMLKKSFSNFISHAFDE